MTTRVIGMDHAPVFTRLRDLLNELETDPVRQQIAIELLMVNHASQATHNLKEYLFVIDSMAKHAGQMRTRISQ